MFTTADAACGGLATETAVTVTAPASGTCRGAVKSACWPGLGTGSIVPTLEFPPVSPLTSQVTAGFASFTVAVNSAVPPTATFADFGEIVTVPGADCPLMETAAFAVLLSSALLTAVTVTLGGMGTYGGAV